MASPVKPRDLRNALPKTGDSTCELLRKTIMMMVLFYRWNKYKYGNDGQFTPEFQAELCSACASQTTP